MPAEFDRPWARQEAALVIDPYAENEIDWDTLATEKRVVGVIHKATSGTTTLDRRYTQRKSEAKQRGFLWGSYHWGEAGDPSAQADYYIKTVAPAEDELIALDLEDAKSGKLMKADEALIFIERIKALTGRYPVLYTNHASTAYLSSHYPDSLFQKVPLWYARFKPAVTDFPTGIWHTYTLWQFSSEILPQLAVAGTKSDMDVNIYNGSVDALKASWPLT